jgi:hypothetical protein
LKPNRVSLQKPIEGREKRQQQPAQQLSLIQLYRSTLIPEHYRLGLAKKTKIYRKNGLKIGWWIKAAICL